MGQRRTLVSYNEGLNRREWLWLERGVLGAESRAAPVGKGVGRPEEAHRAES